MPVKENDKASALFTTARVARQKTKTSKVTVFPVWGILLCVTVRGQRAFFLTRGSILSSFSGKGAGAFAVKARKRAKAHA